MVYCNKNVHVFYDLEIDSSALAAGVYNAKAEVHNVDNTQTFYSGIRTFTIFDKNTSPKGGYAVINTSVTIP